ncbi:dapper homolog 2 [Carlito syrichta]|uniref:Dapper homolog 2 n=1 Tax=Carlito syrichta TaxID=1868482 RepID=A0A1U7SS51_CARSF|nr:dapper homolog 2 [Carlito syrichta]
MVDWRPRSADETTVPTWRPQAAEEGSKLPGSAGDTGQTWDMFRPRPVSTGDLDRALPDEAGFQKPSLDPKSTWLLCLGTDIPPKYQCDLVWQGGREVYPYPSPLHAVALQSPLFALTKETPQSDGPWPPGKPLLGPVGLSTAQTGPVFEAGPAQAYIDRLLSLRGQGTPPRGNVGEQGPPRCEMPSPQKQGGQRQDGRGQPEKLGLAPGREDTRDLTQRGSPLLQRPEPLVGTQHPSSLAEEGPHPSDCCMHGETAGHFVHLPFATREASPIGLKTSLPKNKVTKMKRRSSDKLLWFGKQPSPLPEREGAAHMDPQPPSEWGPSHRPLGVAGLRRRVALAGKVPGRSCSESTLYPVPFFVPLMVTRRDGHRTSAQALFPFEAIPFGAVTKRRQRCWQSSVEISARPRLTNYPEPSPGPPRPTARKAVPLRALASQDARTRSGSDPSEGASWLHSTIAETSEGEASDHTASCFGDLESNSDSDGSTQGRGGLVLDCMAAGQGNLAWLLGGPQQPPQAPLGSRPPLPPMPKLCRIKASKALKKKIRRFQPAALKVMTMV